MLYNYCFLWEHKFLHHIEFLFHLHTYTQLDNLNYKKNCPRLTIYHLGKVYNLIDLFDLDIDLQGKNHSLKHEYLIDIFQQDMEFLKFEEQFLNNILHQLQRTIFVLHLVDTNHFHMHYNRFDLVSIVPNLQNMVYILIYLIHFDNIQNHKEFEMMNLRQEHNNQLTLYRNNVYLIDFDIVLLDIFYKVLFLLNKFPVDIVYNYALHYHNHNPNGIVYNTFHRTKRNQPLYQNNSHTNKCLYFYTDILHMF